MAKERNIPSSSRLSSERDSKKTCSEAGSGYEFTAEVTGVFGLEGVVRMDAGDGREEVRSRVFAVGIFEDGTASSDIGLTSAMVVLWLCSFAFRHVSRSDHLLCGPLEEKGTIGERNSPSTALLDYAA